MQGISIKEAFITLQKQSGVTFVFSEDVKKYAAVKVNLTEKNITVKQAIVQILKNTNLKFTLIDDQVVINENTMSIRGTIRDAESLQPIPGANIRVKGTGTGTVSNNNGEYTIKVPGANSVLTFSYLGFETQ